MKSLCSECNQMTNQKVLCEKSFSRSEEDGNWWEEHKYQIIQCEGCETVSFRKLYNDTAQEHYASYHEENPWTQEVFPKRSLQSLPIKTLVNTPNNIKKIYRETIDAFNNNQAILCSAGIRAIIEGICNDKGIIGGNVINIKGSTIFSKNLDRKIEGLNAKGFLTKFNTEILHELRFLGNDALHELSSPSNDELKMAIDIIEHSIDNIYELQHKAQMLKDEIAKRKK